MNRKHSELDQRSEQLKGLLSEDTPPPMITHTIDTYWQSQGKKFTEFAKISYFSILYKSLHETHLVKPFDKMWKCEMDPASIVEDTERTRFCPQTDRQTKWNQYIPLQFRWSEGIKLYIIVIAYLGI